MQVPTGMELNTGASLLLINIDSIPVKARSNPCRRHAGIKLKTYTAEPVGILGATKVEVM